MYKYTQSQPVLVELRKLRKPYDANREKLAKLNKIDPMISRIYM